MSDVTGLSLSNNATLAYVLSDIPFLCLGLTALAVFLFFIVMRRANLPAVYLYSSSLLAFGSAILDLTQILIRGAQATEKGTGLETVAGIIKTREVGFALTFGFRFLYLWAFVAQRPRYEPRGEEEPRRSQMRLHSASWERWGFLGFILKYGILGAIISIVALQVIWRLVTQYSPIYVAESTIQISVSVLLMAKLLLNLYLSTVTPWWRPFTPYLVPMLALMISTGIGTGNLLFFQFSETTLGRFMQAVESYVLILNMLIFTFYKPQQFVEPVRQRRSSFFTGAPIKADDGPFISPPFIAISEAAPQVTAASSRDSVVSRFSTWMNVSGRRLLRPESDEQKLWHARDPELGFLPMQEKVFEGSDVKKSVEEKPPVSLVSSKLPVPPTPNTLEVPTTEASSHRPQTAVSFASYYGMATPNLTVPSVSVVQDPRGTDSPVYGLNGILATAADSPILSHRSLTPALAYQEDSQASRGSQASLNSFDELLRQQTELDQSIAALRILSTESLQAQPESTEDSPPPETAGDPRATLMSNGESDSRSEFSLSIFPEPPFVLNDRVSSFPESIRAGGTPKAEEFMARVKNGGPLHESGGTQYDVTSFIGDLSIPGIHGEHQRNLSLAESDESAMRSSPVTTNLRPLLLSSTAPPITSLPPSSSSPLTAQPSSPYEYPALKPLFLGSTAPAVASPLGGPRRNMGGAAARRGPRPFISGPRKLSDEIPEAQEFERPRTPPRVQSDAAG